MQAKANNVSKICNAREAEFCRQYLECENAGKAFKLAGYAASSPIAATRKAWTMLQRPRVQEFLTTLKEKANARTYVSRAILTDQLKAAYDLAIELDDPKAMISSTMSMAKLHGLDVKKIDVKHEHSVNIAGATDQLFSLLSGRGAIEGGVGEKAPAIEMVASPPNTSGPFQSSLQPEDVEDAEEIEDDDT